MGYAFQLNMEQLLGVLKILPSSEKSFLKTYLEKELAEDVAHKPITDLLLKGPVMSDEQYQSYQNLRNDFKKWTKKLS